MTGQTAAARSGGARSALFGYAVLRANFNHDAPNYLDNFTGFVLDVLAQRHPEALDENVVGEALRDVFGLTIPDRVAGVLLRRAVKAGKAEAKDQTHFNISAGALAGVHSLEALIAEYERKQASLVAKFVAFVEAEHQDWLTLIQDEPEEHLHSFIERHAAPLLSRAVKGERDSTGGQFEDLQGPEYLVAAFIAKLVEDDALTFGYVVDAVKGAILTGVLDLGPGDLRRNLRDLTLVFDTPVLLAALGYQGATQQRAVQQTLSLARKLGVKTVCFEHTEREIDGVLESVVPVLRSRGKSPGSLRAVDAHFLDATSSPADIAVEQARLRERIQQVGVRVVERPDDYARYGLDEVGLDALLKKHLPTQREATRRYDVESLSAVHRLRRGSSPEHFERSGFILVTSNYGLVLAARQVDERHLWPLAMLDSEVASLLWVRSPAVADDLPREQLLATVYAGMQPGSHLWLRYVEEIERLEARGEVDQDEALILRSRPEARRALMDITLGEADIVTSDSIGAVVERVRESLEAPLRLALDEVGRERDEALRTSDMVARSANDLRRSAQSHVESAHSKAVEDARKIEALSGRLDSIEGERQEQDARIRRRSERTAKRLVRFLIGLFAALLIAPAGLKLALPGTLARLPSGMSVAALVGGVVIFILGALRHFFGGSLNGWVRPLEERLAIRLERRARRKAGLPAAQA